MQQYTGCIIECGSDKWKLGRWSYSLFTGKRKTLLSITGYRTGQRTGEAGPTTAWSQQRTMLLKDNRDEDPHDAFISDVTKWA